MSRVLEAQARRREERNRAHAEREAAMQEAARRTWGIRQTCTHPLAFLRSARPVDSIVHAHCEMCGRDVHVVVRSQLSVEARGRSAERLTSRYSKEFGTEAHEPSWHEAGAPILAARALVRRGRWEMVR